MFSFPDVVALTGKSRVEIRFLEALYFFQEFKAHCGSGATQNPEYDTFRWIAYSDAFLISLLSIQDLVGPKKRAQFLAGYDNLKKQNAKIARHYAPNPLLVLKLMRNRTVHHCVLGAPGEGRGKGNVSRVINVRVGGADAGAWVETRITFAEMEMELKRIMAKYRRDKKKNPPNPKRDVTETRQYLKRLQRERHPDIRLEVVFREGYELVAKICGLSVPAPRQ